MKSLITTDSTCDLTSELYKKYNIKVLPLMVTLGDKTYQDGVDIKPDDIYAHFDKTGELPKTGARSPEDFHDFFKKYTDEGYEIVHIGIGSDLSSSFNNATIASKDLKGVYIVDSKNLSSAIGLLCMYASELASSGKFTAEEIAKKVEERVPNTQASFIVEKLKFLYKGGRCSMLAMLGANLLRIKPGIQVKDGKLGVGKKYMGAYLSCMQKYIEDTLKTYNNPDNTRIMITYSTATPEMIDLAKKTVEKLGHFKEILPTQAGSVINSHCGQNTLGVLFINDGDEGHY